MRRLLLAIVCTVLLQTGVSAAVAAPAREPPQLPPGWSYRLPDRGRTPRLDGLLDALPAILDSSGARWGIGIRDLNTGETLALNVAESFPAASLYKLGVMLEVEQRIADGSLAPESPVAITAYDVDPAFGGSLLGVGDVLAVRDALDWMVTRSDNGAALALVRTLGGGSAVNSRFQALHMWQSVFDEEAVTSPADQLRLFTELTDGEAAAPEASAAALALLAQQRVNDRIPRGLPAEADWIVAHKTGDTDEVIADSGIVATPDSTYVLTLMAADIDSDLDTRASFATISTAVYDAFATSSPEPDGGALYAMLAASR